MDYTPISELVSSSTTPWRYVAALVFVLCAAIILSLIARNGNPDGTLSALFPVGVIMSLLVFFALVYAAEHSRIATQDKLVATTTESVLKKYEFDAVQIEGEDWEKISTGIDATFSTTAGESIVGTIRVEESGEPFVYFSTNGVAPLTLTPEQLLRNGATDTPAVDTPAVPEESYNPEVDGEAVG